MDRRKFVRSILAGSGVLATTPSGLFANALLESPKTKRIPSSGERIPVIGMGTWITFNAEPVPSLIQQRTEVLRVFFEMGGALIDSSPMYGSAERVVGECLKRLEYPESLFSATKVWTSSTANGVKQVEDSERLWGVERLDLEQVHNLVNWRDHLRTLRRYKEEGRIRYLGVTTSHGRRHDELQKIMKNEPLDFVQVTYNIQRREVENHLLPLAQDLGVAVIANRPYGGGSIIKRLQRGKRLPDWAEEVGASDWPQFLLKFIVSHPAVTCAIPATSKVGHMRENMAASLGRMPDASQRVKMAQYIASL